MTDARTNRRMAIVFAVLLLGLVAVPFRAWYLGVVDAERTLARGGWQTESTLRFEGPRGAIVDREGRELARNALTWEVGFDPQFFFRHEVDRLDELLPVLEPVGLDRDRFHEWAQADVGTLPRHVVLARDVSPGRMQEMEESLRALRVRAVTRTPRYRRVYPERELASHTLGFLRRDGSRGLAGIERSFDAQLRGDSVTYQVERDGRRSPYLFDSPPDLRSASGHEVSLTLDAALQRQTERALLDTLNEYEAEAGVVIVSRPDTGEILAMAGAPSPDPNRANAYPPELWQHPAVSKVWEPGSTAKIFTWGAALEEGLVRLDEEIETHRGRHRVGGHWVRDIHRESSMTAAEALARSSNIASYKIGLRLDQDIHRNYLTSLGFAHPTQVRLPSDEPGLLRATPWREIEHANISFGHGVATSPLQLHMAVAAIANDGVRMRPQLVRSISRADGEPIFAIGEGEAVERVFSSATVRALRTAMIETTRGRGTGRAAAIEGIEVAGKTGTAELWNSELGAYESEYLSSFVGFVPADEPELVVTVQILRPNREIGYFGGQVAGSLFATVATAGLRSIGHYVPREPFPHDGRAVESVDAGGDRGHAASAAAAPHVGSADEADAGQASRDDESRFDVLAQGADGGPAVRDVPQLVGLEPVDAVRAAASLGFRVDFTGTGVVRSQVPAAGEAASRDTPLRLELGDPLFRRVEPQSFLQGMNR